MPSEHNGEDRSVHDSYKGDVEPVYEVFCAMHHIVQSKSIVRYDVPESMKLVVTAVQPQTFENACGVYGAAVQEASR